MRKRLIGGLTALLFLFLPMRAEALGQLGARAYVLAEASTGRILAAQNEQEQLPMASTTKIMTALLAMERGDLEQIVTVPQECAGVEGSSMYLRGGETVSMRELVYGLMLASGNDAAETIARELGGSIEGFAAMMNARARELGAVHTHFVTPHGLPNAEHYTTAEDLARIAAYAMQNETFRTIVGTAAMDFPADADSPARYLRNKNKLLWQYDGGNGIKTGYTDAAGKCLVGGAERGGMQLVSVVLNDRGMFEDSMELLDYGFSSYSMQCAVQKGTVMGSVRVENSMTERVNFCAAEDIYLPLRAEECNIVDEQIILPAALAAPLVKGDAVGTLTVSISGVPLGSTALVAAEDAEALTAWQRLKRKLCGWFS